MIEVDDKVRENWSGIVGRVLDIDDSDLAPVMALVEWPAKTEWVRRDVLERIE